MGKLSLSLSPYPICFHKFFLNGFPTAEAVCYNYHKRMEATCLRPCVSFIKDSGAICHSHDIPNRR